jgi:hypothetical protein
MIEQIVLAKTPIVFDYRAFDHWNIPHIGQDNHLSPPQGGVTSTSEDANAQDVQDAVQPITDELYKLFKAPLWWIVETIIPTPCTFQNAQGKRFTIWM